MSDQEQPNPTCEDDPATDGDLDAVLAQLPLDRIRFVIARTECRTNKEAAVAIGLTESAVKSWPPEEKALIERALRLMAHDGVVTAVHLRRRHLAKAMAVKVKGLDSDDEKVRQGVATEVIEWELGKATQPNKDDSPANLAMADMLAALRRTLPTDGT